MATASVTAGRVSIRIISGRVLAVAVTDKTGKTGRVTAKTISRIVASANSGTERPVSARSESTVPTGRSRRTAASVASARRTATHRATASTRRAKVVLRVRPRTLSTYL